MGDGEWKCVFARITAPAHFCALSLQTKPDRPHQNPIPPRGRNPKQWEPSTDRDFVEFPPPCDEAGKLGTCSGDTARWSDNHLGLQIVDMLQVPEALPVGDYVMQWRWGECVMCDGPLSGRAAHNLPRCLGLVRAIHPCSVLMFLPRVFDPLLRVSD